MDLNQLEDHSIQTQLVLYERPEYRAWEAMIDVFKEHKITTERRFSWPKLSTAKSKGSQIEHLKQIAKICDDKNYDIRDFFRTILSYIDKAYELVTVRDFLRESFLSRYDNERGDVRIKERYLWQVKYCKSTVPAVIPHIYQTENDFLLDPHQPFDAWFRILHTNHLDTRIFAMYGNEAANEILHNTALYKFLKVLDGTVIDLSRILGKTYG